MQLCPSFFYLRLFIPPSQDIFCPVIHEDSLLNKNTARLARSSGVPILFIGCFAALASLIFSLLVIFSANGVSVKEGEMQLTRTFGAYSEASDLVNPSRAPLAPAILE